MAPAPQSFHLSVPDEQIADLKQRLSRTRFPDQAPDGPWAYGTDLTYMRDLVSYWRDGFDWRAQEAALNAFPQFKARVHDIDVHFLHVPGKGPAPKPLLLMHGWPGSVFEFLDFIPLLTDPARFGGDPADAFTVIAPSLPGFGLSFAPGQKRFNIEQMADCLASLMTDTLGFQRFGAQGGDYGAFVSSRLAYAYPERMTGIHINLLTVRRDVAPPPSPTPEEARYYEELAVWLKEETGYQWIQGTRPQTLAYGLTDSPAGLAAWIAEKFRVWTDPRSTVNRDHVLANIALYWFTGAIGSSFWPYYARMHGPWPIPGDRKIDVPTGYCAFPHEIMRPPRSVAETMYGNIQRWTPMPQGGHFAAMEQPQALAEEVRAFFRGLG